MKEQQITKIEAGMTLVFDTLRWDEGWEFGGPVLLLSPVIKCFEEAESHEHIVESVMIDVVVQGIIPLSDGIKEWEWRGYKLPVLRRRFREALAGKKFPKVGYRAERSMVRVIVDEDEHRRFPCSPLELTWEDVPHGPAIAAVDAASRKFINQTLCQTNQKLSTAQL